MRTLPKILGACAIAALAGTAAWASGAPTQHQLNVLLPGGGTEVITYSGDVAPQVTIAPGDFAPVSFWPSQAFGAMPFDTVSFGAMPVDRIAAAMDADMASMIRQADAMMAMPMMVPGFNGVTEAGLAQMPPGSQSYSVISTMNGNNVCTRSVEITSNGTGGTPKVVHRSSGNCAAATPDNSVLFHSFPAQNSHLMTIKAMVPGFAPSRPHI